MLTNVRVLKVIDAPADRAWAAIRAIGGLDRWFPVITRCRVLGEGVGATRELSLADGGEIIDVIDEIDDGRRRFRYTRIAHPFPLSNYQGEVLVRAAGESKSEISWTVRFDIGEKEREAVCAFIHDALSGGVDGLEKHLK